jgi:hypothetical protein
LRAQFPILASAPDHLVLRYAELDALAAVLWNSLIEQGPVNSDGEPKRLITEYRRLLMELRSLAGTLGILNSDEPDAIAALLGEA